MSAGCYTCDGTVVHERLAHSHGTPTRFRYRMTTALVDVDRLDRNRMPARWLFGARARALTIRPRDHLRTEHGPTCRARALACLERHGIDPSTVGRIHLHTGMRVLGYGFDPVSLWLCRDHAGEPLAVIVDVNNTYGESHPYVVHRDEQQPTALARGQWRAERTKQFHVSPFLELDMRYRLRVGWPDPASSTPLVLDVAVLHGERTVFRGVQVMHPRPMHARSLLASQLRSPLMPQRTTLLIHWQALRLWRGGARFHRKPPWVAGRGSRIESERRDAA